LQPNYPKYDMLLGCFLYPQFYAHARMCKHVYQRIKAEFVYSAAQHVIQARLRDAEAFGRFALRCASGGATHA
jgi:hypothetical protein